MQGCIAVLNAGSSSIKFAVYDEDASQAMLFRGQIEQIGIAPRLRIVGARNEVLKEQAWPGNDLDFQSATLEIFHASMALLNGKPVGGIGHRVVHGGTKYSVPVQVTEQVLDYLDELVPLAPLHQPNNLAPIHAIASAAPHLRQVACFDTAFHRNQPELAQLFALPRSITETGVRRYGFHGLSYEYIVSRLKDVAPELAQARVVIAHLGNGASACAVDNGRSVSSTMGFTAVDGLMMGTRCGSIDPGVLLYLMDRHGMDRGALENLIYRQSGLLGVSGISADMRTLRASAEPAAREATDLFVYRIVREIGSLAAALGGLDGLVFTGGIGENDAATRAEVSAGCRWLGLELDEARNQGGSGQISRDGSKLSAWVIRTDEERMIARHILALL
jgi:acetate kinase